MKSKAFFSTLLICLLVLAAVLAINILAGKFRARIDLTQDRAHTLSAGTRSMLSKLGTPTQVRLYVSTGDASMPPFLKSYVQRVEDLLAEMSQASSGKLEVIRLSPTPDSDAEDSARMDGIEPHPLPDGSGLYLGLSASMLDQKVALPFLAPDRERLLEYDIARAIARVSATERPKLGIMSPLRVLGQPMSLMMPSGDGPKPWVLVEELQRDFDVREVPMTSPEIPSDLDVLLVIHPREITAAAQYSLDQFVLRGGRLVAFLDPYCIFDGGTSGSPTSSTLSLLLPAWGLEFPQNTVLADLDFEGKLRDGRAPALLDLTPLAMNRNDVLTSGLDSILMAFAGTYSIKPDKISTSEVLIHSSEMSQLVQPSVARTSPDSIIRNFEPSKTQFPLAVRLTGNFSSAFPDGKPEGSAAKADHLKQSTSPSSVILVGDADMLHDQLSVTEVRGLYPGGKMFIPTNGNLVLAQSAVEQLAGDEDLIAVRSRAVLNRPFTVVTAMQAEAEQKFQSTIRDLEASLKEAQNRLASLQQKKEDGQRFLLSTEQQREIESFRAKESEVKKQLKETRRALRSEIDALETRLKWMNLAAVPLLVALVAIFYAILRRKSSSAR